MSPITHLSECDPRRLNAYLRGLVDGREQVAIEDHLNRCSACCQMIEALAADREFWSVTTQALETLEEAKTLSQTVDLSLTALSARAALAPTEAAIDVELKSQEEMLGRWLEPSTHPRSLGRIRKYEVFDVVGQGGMGLVLRALDTELNREVAIKTMAHHVTSQPEARLRLAREARTVAGLSHPHVVPIYGMESWRDVPLIVMPLISGGTLQQYAAHRQLTLQEILATALQIASALAALHAAGIVHRDLKPSNILLKDGLRHVLLSDFGLARSAGDNAVTQSDALAGTPNFMSPEQALGQKIDVRSDLFSFGSVLYWMCAGVCPFEGKSSYDTLAQIVHADLQTSALERQQIPDFLQQLIRPLLAKDPTQRWESAAQVVGLLQAGLAHYQSPENALPPELSQATRSVRPVGFFLPRFLTSPRSAVAVLVVVLVLAGIVYWPPSAIEKTPDSGTALAQPDLESNVSPPPTPEATKLGNSILRKSNEASNNASAEADLRVERYGPLDELDQLAMRSDLAAGRELRYWLRRMAYLRVDEIPPAALPAVQTLVQHPDLATRELAQVILNKNPFQEVSSQAVRFAAPSKDADQSTGEPADLNKKTEQLIENPFEEVIKDGGL
jgi:eukaryotic-like serine/threonine-protein kinase